MRLALRCSRLWPLLGCLNWHNDVWRLGTICSYCPLRCILRNSIWRSFTSNCCWQGYLEYPAWTAEWIDGWILVLVFSGWWLHVLCPNVIVLICQNELNERNTFIKVWQKCCIYYWWEHAPRVLQRRTAYQRANTIHLELNPHNSRAWSALSEWLCFAFCHKKVSWLSSSKVQPVHHMDSSPSGKPMVSKTESHTEKYTEKSEEANPYVHQELISAKKNLSY